VMMVSQGGTGAGTSGRAVRAIYERLFGVHGGTVHPSTSVLVGGEVAADLPTIDSTGVPAAPAHAPAVAAGSGSPATSADGNAATSAGSERQAEAARPPAATGESP